MNNIQIIILAAGCGSRMKSNKPKVLQKLAGLSLLQRIVNTSKKITDEISIIYGFGGDIVKNSIDADINWIYQKNQNGTGSAVRLALPYIDKYKKTIILYGDVALISLKTLTKLADNDKFTLLTAIFDNPLGYGRIKRKKGNIVSIIEQKDADNNELKISEINTGIMVISGELLHKYLPNLSDNNVQKEFYLTDIVKMCVADEVDINSINPENNLEIAGVNDKLQLQNLERDYQVLQAEDFMLNGLTILDKNRFDNRGELSFKNDCKVDINVIFEGKNILDENVSIGAGCIIKNSQIACNVKILANSIIEDSIIGANAVIGPFARIRPETNLAENTKVGNFVEIKKSIIGKYSKVNHLSYVGDATIGENVNVGAGVITCNYDGVNKHQTIIEDNAFIGSNSALIAPVKIGQNAIIGAGSSISKDCEKGKITLTRTKQFSFKGKKLNK